MVVTELRITGIQRGLISLFPTGGYFVEAGAHDGVGDSCTKQLEDAGWEGLCVEPSSAFHGLTLSRRCSKLNCCLWHLDGYVDFAEVAGEGIELSGIPFCFGDKWRGHRDGAKVTSKRCMTLASALRACRAPAEFEFLCLDTEGSELVILRHHNFDSYRPKVIQVEHNGVIERAGVLAVLLLDRGYSLIDNNEINALFVDRRLL